MLATERKNQAARSRTGRERRRARGGWSSANRRRRENLAFGESALGRGLDLDHVVRRGLLLAGG